MRMGRESNHGSRGKDWRSHALLDPEVHVWQNKGGLYAQRPIARARSFLGGRGWKLLTKYMKQKCHKIKTITKHPKMCKIFKKQHKNNDNNNKKQNTRADQQQIPCKNSLKGFLLKRPRTPNAYLKRNCLQGLQVGRFPLRTVIHFSIVYPLQYLFLLEGDILPF